MSAIGIELPRAFNGKGGVEPAHKSEPLSPSELASLAKAWDTLEDRKRILRMKPLPKAQEVPKKEPLAKRRALTGFSES